MDSVQPQYLFPPQDTCTHPYLSYLQEMNHDKVCQKKKNEVEIEYKDKVVIKEFLINPLKRTYLGTVRLVSLLEVFSMLVNINCNLWFHRRDRKCIDGREKTFM